MPKRKGSAQTAKANAARRKGPAYVEHMDDVDELNELITSLVLSNKRLRERCFKLFCKLGDERVKAADLERILMGETPIERCVECGEECSDC